MNGDRTTTPPLEVPAELALVGTAAAPDEDEDDDGVPPAAPVLLGVLVLLGAAVVVPVEVGLAADGADVPVDPPRALAVVVVVRRASVVTEAAGAAGIAALLVAGGAAAVSRVTGTAVRVTAALVGVAPGVVVVEVDDAVGRGLVVVPEPLAGAGEGLVVGVLEPPPVGLVPEVGVPVEPLVGVLLVGVPVGLPVWPPDGDPVGESVGLGLGLPVAPSVAPPVGLSLGEPDGLGEAPSEAPPVGVPPEPPEAPVPAVGLLPVSDGWDSTGWLPAVPVSHAPPSPSTDGVAHAVAAAAAPLPSGPITSSPAPTRAIASVLAARPRRAGPRGAVRSTSSRTAALRSS